MTGGVAGVVLAAGSSSRFEAPYPKQLAPWFGETLVHRAARVALAHLDPVVVVVGHRAAEVRDAVADLAAPGVLRVVDNLAWREGQSTSIGAAVSALGPDASASLFLPCDQPGIDDTVIEAMISAWHHRRPATRALVPNYPLPDGTRRLGAPVLFAAALNPRLAELTGDEGGRQILEQLGEAVVAVDLPAAACDDDIDTISDLFRLQSQFHRRATDSS